MIEFTDKTKSLLRRVAATSQSDFLYAGDHQVTAMCPQYEIALLMMRKRRKFFVVFLAFWDTK
ncbi:MAG: hypothetical protein QM754_17495 [Tepidisphaeraceae bacterium]